MSKISTPNQWAPVVFLDAGINNGIRTGERLILEPVGTEEAAMQIAKDVCLSMPDAIACTIQPFR